MTDLTASHVRALMGEWRLALAAERKSPKTIALYLDAVGRYLAWTETRELPPMRRTTLQTWVTDMLDSGRSPSTARIRQQAVRRYAAWLFAVGHLGSRPVPGHDLAQAGPAGGRPAHRRPGPRPAADL